LILIFVKPTINEGERPADRVQDFGMLETAIVRDRPDPSIVMMRSVPIVVLLLSLGCSKQGHISKLFGDRNVETIRSPERVECYRLRPPRTTNEVRKQGSTPLYNLWPVLAGPIIVDTKTAADLSKALLDEKTYCLWDEGKGCIPSPGVMLRFIRDTGSVDIAFCFECDMLFTYQGSEPIYGANFDYSHNSLLTYFVKLFPTDPDLPKLIRR
jgi:hypothetical protein